MADEKMQEAMQEATTAKMLGAYRRELEAEGFDPDPIRDFLNHASRMSAGARITVGAEFMRDGRDG